MTVLSIEGLTKQFGKFKALDGLELELKEGEIFGFIGPNGAGKSTTIKAVLGMLKPTQGKITLFDKDATKDIAQVHKDIAFVPGDVNLWPNLTGGEIIDFLLSLHDNANYERKKALIKRFGLDTSKKCKTYSTGNRQKVALIAAFSIDAKLYILDEPTSGLDPLMEDVFQHCVEEVKHAGKTVLLSSHILSEVEKLCDRIGIIREGKLVASGTLDEMRHITRMQFMVESNDCLEGLSRLSSVHNLEQDGRSYHFEVDADQVTEVVRFLSEFKLNKLESTPPTLEAIFKRNYDENDEAGDSYESLNP